MGQRSASMMELPALVPNGACLMCAREPRGREREGSRQVGGESFSLLERSSRALAEYSHRPCPSSAHQTAILPSRNTSRPPITHTHTHTPGPCASDTRLRRYHSCHLARVSALQTTARPQVAHHSILVRPLTTRILLHTFNGFRVAPLLASTAGCS